MRALLAAERLPREKRHENKAVVYDLRPLVMGLRVDELAATSSAPLAADTCALAGAEPRAAAVCLWMRLRHSQDEGSGRAEEVVAALGDAMPGGPRVGLDASRNIEIVHPVRERLWLTGELAA
jgi:hypothetical protein